MELPRRKDQNHLQRKGHKRKLEDEYNAELEFPDEDDNNDKAPLDDTAWKSLLNSINRQVLVLNSFYSWKDSDRAAVKRAAHVVAELAKNGEGFVLELDEFFAAFF